MLTLPGNRMDKLCWGSTLASSFIRGLFLCILTNFLTSLNNSFCFL